MMTPSDQPSLAMLMVATQRALDDLGQVKESLVERYMARSERRDAEVAALRRSEKEPQYLVRLKIGTTIWPLSA